VEALFDNGDEHVHGNGAPELGLDGVLGGPVEGLDPQVLLEPTEEEFHLPAALLELGDGQRGQGEVVGEEDEPAAVFRIEVANPPEAFRVALVAGEAEVPDDLIGGDPARPVDRPRIEVPEPEVPLGPRHECSK